MTCEDDYEVSEQNYVDPAEMMSHNEVFTRCLNLYVERSAAYGDVWRRYGAVANVINAARKVDRLMETWYDGLINGTIPELHKDALDDAYDAINYLAFFIRSIQEGNFLGIRPPRPAHPEGMRLVHPSAGQEYDVAPAGTNRDHLPTGGIYPDERGPWDQG